MKTNKYTYLSYLILCVWIAFTACTDDTFVHDSGTFDYNSITLKVNMPTPVVCNPMTRAGAEDFNKMNDLNVVFAEGGDDNSAIKSIYYISLDGTTADDGVSYSNEQNDASGNITAFSLHFTSDWLKTNNLSANEGKFYLVANWGSEIEVETVGALKELKAGSITIGETGGRIEAPNVMFGEAVGNESGAPSHPNGDTNTLCRVLNVGLERTAAMITLVMNGEGLDDGIVITPTRVSLHNVPNECTIGKPNIVPTVNNDGINPATGTVSLVGEIEDGSTFSGGASLVGSGTQGWSSFNDDQRYKTTVGKHYSDDYSDQSVSSLFMYENVHKEGFGAEETNQVYKRPEGVEQNADAIKNNSGSCSYIEVEAKYVLYEDNSMNIQQKGTASWRFFLGKDAFSDFDVERNNYYKIDLNLSGTAIKEGEYSWRVSSDLEEPVIVGETEMVVGGGGEMFCVEFVDPAHSQNFKLVGTDATFVYVYSAKGSSYSWNTVSEVGNGSYKYYMTANSQLWFYVQPFLPNSDDTRTERSCEIKFYETDGQTELASLTFTQYKPIKVEVAKEDAEAMPEVKNMIETYYNYTFATNTEPFTFYVDRVDRNAMPWGFSGVTLDANHSSGFENVYHLIDPLNPGSNCSAHVEYAKYYLPTGKGFKNADGYIDYSNGSCMMHAAMENYFQQYYPKPDANVTPDDILRTELPPRPGDTDDNTPVERTYGWCVPSIVGWQLLEKLEEHKGIFDTAHPIARWTSYWTSNAGTLSMQEDYPDLNIDGRTRAFVYQFDMGLDKIQEGQHYPGNLLLPRSTPLKYRLINMESKYRKDVDFEPDPME